MANELLPSLARDAAPRPIDRRVAALLEVLRDPFAERDAVLTRLRISRAHLTTLFARDVGLPLRSFALWRRLLSGIGACAQFDATRAAHMAGFADLAHFSRTSRKLLGRCPNALRVDLLW